MSSMSQSTQELRRRIKATQSLRKITKAMEMIAASKMRRSQVSATASKPYAALAWDMRSALAASSWQIVDGNEDKMHPLLKMPKTGASLVVLITSNRGLCGSLNTIVVNHALGLLKDAPDAKFMSIGKKGERALLRRNKKISAAYDNFNTIPSSGEVRSIARAIMDLFLSGHASSVTLVFADFISTVHYKPKAFRLLPFALSAESITDSKKFHSEYLFEPTPKEVLSALLPRLVEFQIYQAVLESLASEHSARMVAMRNATEAADELVNDFTLTYNTLRQSSITAELSEITSGRKALSR